ncbi:MAG: hypothetical protein HC933_19430, partial [Pleurocapsa sp. SU_196_0]|nr:hypothetical protein [Pleurocapsa sp. SU_196_0]
VLIAQASHAPPHARSAQLRVPHGVQEQVPQGTTAVQRPSVRWRASLRRSVARTGQEGKDRGYGTLGVAHEIERADLAGKYNTPLGEITFDKEGEVQQKNFYVAQIKMNSDGKTGGFEYLK